MSAERALAELLYDLHCLRTVMADVAGGKLGTEKWTTTTTAGIAVKLLDDYTARAKRSRCLACDGPLGG